MSWDLYKVASGLDQKDEKIQVATLLHVLGKECVEIFSNFVWDSEDDRGKDRRQRTEASMGNAL